MAKTNREIENPFIIRVSVKDRGGKYRKVSVSPVLYSAVAEIGARQPIPVMADEVIKKAAARLSPDDAPKSSFSRLVQDELVLCLVELLAGEETKDRVIQRVLQAEAERV